MTTAPQTPEPSTKALWRLAGVHYSAAADVRDDDMGPNVLGSGLRRVFNAGRSQALKEAAHIIETEESPFHAVPDTEVFWLSREYIARSIRAAAIQTGEPTE